MSHEPPQSNPGRIPGMRPKLASKHGLPVSARDTIPEWTARYHEILAGYLASTEERYLEMAGQLGREMVHADIPPEDITEIHAMAVLRWAQNSPESSLLSTTERLTAPLTEIMTAYGMAFREMQEQMHSSMEMRLHYQQIRHALGDTIETITKIRETNDPYTAAHQHRVALLACAIAKRLGLEEERVEGLRMAATLHDIGMVQMPKNIFDKSTQLSKNEYKTVQSHPQVSYDMLKDIEFPWPIAEITRQHHERVDGSGYPRGLHNDEILLEAKIISVADTVEAMVSHRPYRSSHDIKEALEEIRTYRGSYFDPCVVDICCQLFDEKAFAFPLD